MAVHILETHGKQRVKGHCTTWFLQGHIINTHEQPTHKQNYPSPAFCVCFIHEDGGSEKLNDQNDALITKPRILLCVPFFSYQGQAFT